MSVWEAAKNGDLVAVKDTVENLSNINEHDDNGFSALHHACEQGHFLIAEYLFQRQANLNDLTEGKERIFEDEESDPKYSLHLAAGKGHKDIVEFLLKNGVDVNCKTVSFYTTPLHFASRMGYLSVAKHLILQGGDVDSRDTIDDTPLHESCESGHLSLVKYLLNAGSDINSTYDYGHTPYYTCYGNLTIEKFLIGKGCNLQSTNEVGKTPLQLSREYILCALKACSYLKKRVHISKIVS